MFGGWLGIYELAYHTIDNTTHRQQQQYSTHLALVLTVILYIPGIKFFGIISQAGIAHKVLRFIVCATVAVFYTEYLVLSDLVFDYIWISTISKHVSV